jgi:hypothetical protein
MAKGLAVGLDKGHIVSKIEVPSGIRAQRRIILLNISKKESSPY